MDETTESTKKLAQTLNIKINSIIKNEDEAKILTPENMKKDLEVFCQILQ